MPRANQIALPGLAALLVGAALIHGAPLPARAQATAPASPNAASATTSSSPAPVAAKACADRWNALKAANQTGETTYRDFYQSCMAGAAQAGSAGPAPPAAKPATPTGPAATAARPTIRQCADLWSELKAKNQTGDLTYRDFAQQCLAGSGPAEPAKDAAKAEAKNAPTDAKPDGASSATTKAETPPAVVTTLAPPPPEGLQKPTDEADRAAVNRCNGEWQAYKARHNLSGAKAWHVFMARCLP